MNAVGIMQGRLSPPSAKGLQAFPWKTWREEFDHARECGIDGIEWLFDVENSENNPIWTDPGLDDIRSRIDATGVPVLSVCAHYFMLRPFFRVTEAEAEASGATLMNLIDRAAVIGARTVLLPVLETSEVRTAQEKSQLLRHLLPVLDRAGERGVRLGLETELPAKEYGDLIAAAQHPSLGAYFDTGNAAARGYDIVADVRLLGAHLCGVHIKDRRVAGSTVPLGEGAANFSAFFEAVAETGYQGPLVLETASGPDFLGMAAEHARFVRNLL